MKHQHRGAKSADAGPSQRQLRAGELVRHALIEALREGDLHDEALQDASVTVTEVRMSPDLKHATCFVEPLGAGVARADSKQGLGDSLAGEVVAALNRHSKFLRGKLGRRIDMKFTPDLRFVHDESFDEAARMDALFNRPEVKRDLS
jgi:ribosome-binding factor A